MSIADSLLPEFDQEMANTRVLLERTPETDTSWKPHPKSMELGRLAIHLATLPQWATMTLAETELDIHPPGEPAQTMPPFESTAAMLALFDEHTRTARAAIAATSDNDFMVSWTLKNAGVALFSMPRIAVLRSFVMNHFIHHRGQYTVYLRLRSVPLPELYGPTADTM
jgi:uncharacterized damage-inducible protein DinB